MLHLNNDMDELLRRAAENYPLRTDNPDWESVQKKMQAAPKFTCADIISKRKSYKGLLFIFLLLPALSTVDYKLVTASNSYIAEIKKSVIVSTTDHFVKQFNNVDAVKDQAATQSPQAFKRTSIASFITSDAVVNNIYFHKMTNSLKNNQPAAIADAGQYRNTSVKKQSFNVKEKSSAAINSAGETDDITSVNENKELLKQEQAAKIKKQDPDSIVKTTKSSVGENKNLLAKEVAITLKKTVKEKSSLRHFYIGLIGGLDLSTVKFEPIDKIGSGYGIIAGYHFSKKWFVETGIVRDKKYYDTKGKYFNMKNYSLPASVHIDYVSGNCNMIEIPVNIHYTFFNKKRATFFAAAGASSYLMKKECYDYIITYNAGTPYSKEFNYNTKSTFLFPVINIGGGYTHTLGRTGSLRIEPYLKIPVNKIGTGQLPVQSAGIYLGLTKNIF